MYQWFNGVQQENFWQMQFWLNPTWQLCYLLQVTLIVSWSMKPWTTCWSIELWHVHLQSKKTKNPRYLYKGKRMKLLTHGAVFQIIPGQSSYCFFERCNFCFLVRCHLLLRVKLQLLVLWMSLTIKEWPQRTTTRTSPTNDSRILIGFQWKGELRIRQSGSQLVMATFCGYIAIFFAMSYIVLAQHESRIM